MCREEALMLSSLKERLSEQPAVRLICIAGEHLGHEEFTEKYWRGELFFDVGKKVWYPAMASGKMVLSGIISYLCCGIVAKNILASHELVRTRGPF